MAIPVYLGIDANDEETKIFKKRGKTRGPQRHDEAWNPKGVSLKGVLKEERPQREGVKREIMESTLAESKKFTGPSVTPPAVKERRETTKKKNLAPRIKEETTSTEPKGESTVGVDRASSVVKYDAFSRGSISHIDIHRCSTTHGKEGYGYREATFGQDT